jgi:hypothetical protein
MPPVEMHQALDTAIDQVLTTMFFSDAERVEDCGAPPGDAVRASLAFHGEPSGRFYLWIEPAAARELTGAFLGLDAAEVHPPQIQETVRELANMICGSFVSLFETEVLFLLDAPQIDGFDPPDPQRCCRRRLRLDAGELEIWLELEGGQS